MVARWMRLSGFAGSDPRVSEARTPQDSSQEPPETPEPPPREPYYVGRAPPIGLHTVPLGAMGLQRAPEGATASYRAP